MKIAINAGHHIPEDCGACGCNCKEAELVYIYADKLVQKLKTVNYDTILICNNELQGICDESNNFNADIFISIHLNSIKDNKTVYGTETFYCEGSTNGKILASCIQYHISNMMIKYRAKQRDDKAEYKVAYNADRGIKTNSLYVTKHTNAVAALIEIGFINNPLEEDILKTYPDEIVDAIYKGIVDYLKEI